MVSLLRRRRTAAILRHLTGVVATTTLYWTSNLHMHLQGKSGVGVQKQEAPEDLFHLTHFFMML